MKLHRFDDIKEFCDRTQPYLLQQEAEHNLLLGLSHTLLHDPNRYSAPPYLAVVEANGDPVAVALKTPPHNLVLSKASDLDALKLLVHDLHDRSVQLPGVSGLVTEAQTFLASWQRVTGQPHQLTMHLRIHELTAVQSLPTAPGLLRPANLADRPLLLTWFQAFFDEALPSAKATAERAVDSALQRQSVYLWEDGVPVSFACGNQFLPNAGRIGPVYTPPDQRRKGYATACVAALSQQLLDRGCQRCYLFTDLANPTSNHIYQAIGYRSICDWYEYSFTLQEPS